jgi:hypothetical protein
MAGTVFPPMASRYTPRLARASATWGGILEMTISPPELHHDYLHEEPPACCANLHCIFGLLHASLSSRQFARSHNAVHIRTTLGFNKSDRSGTTGGDTACKVQVVDTRYEIPAKTSLDPDSTTMRSLIQDTSPM